MASGEPRSRNRADPYLSSLSGDAAERVTIMKWARYLGATFGTTGALRALQYYREINWISDSVKRTMTEYVRGLPIEDLDRQEDADTSLTDALSSLEGTHFEEHAKSLEFIAAIGDNNIEHSLASLQLTENGSLGLSGARGDLSGRSPDLFTAHGVDGTERLPEETLEASTADDPGSEHDGLRSGDSPRQGGSTRTDRHDRASMSREPDSGGDGSPAGSQVSTARPEEVDSAGSDRADPRSDRGTGPSSRTDRDGSSSPRDGPGERTDPTSRETASDPADDPDETAPSSSPGEAVPDGEDDGGSPSTPVESGSSETTGSSEHADDGSSLGDVGDEASTDGTEGDRSTGETNDPETDEVPPDEERCIALTRDGERCSRRAMDGSDYCKQHAP